MIYEWLESWYIQIKMFKCLNFKQKSGENIQYQYVGMGGLCGGLGLRISHWVFECEEIASIYGNSIKAHQDRALKMFVKIGCFLGMALCACFLMQSWKMKTIFKCRLEINCSVPKVWPPIKSLLVGDQIINSFLSAEAVIMTKKKKKSPWGHRLSAAAWKHCLLAKLVTIISEKGELCIGWRTWYSAGADALSMHAISGAVMVHRSGQITEVNMWAGGARAADQSAHWDGSHSQWLGHNVL